MSTLATDQQMQVSLGVFVRKDNKILLGKRINVIYSGFWALPGGKLEFGESFEDCVTREVYEETGLHVKNITFATTENYPFPDKHKHVVMLYFVADYESGEVTLTEPEKCSEWKWFGYEKLPNPISFQKIFDKGFSPFK
jgi:8-oxo-dGTP diphosphatase